MGADQDTAAGKRGQSRIGIAVLGVAAVVAAVSVGYNVFGTDDAADGDQLAADFPATVEELRAAAEASPSDARPWQELGFVHFERGEFAQAAEAYEGAVARDGGQAVLWSALGEARVMASERDPLPPAALEAFRKAAELDPTDPRARYFLNVQKDLDGDHEGAIAGWLDLLADTPAGAPWENDLVRTIQQVGTINGIDVDARLGTAMDARQIAPPSSMPGPTQEQVAAAGAMRPSDQREMAEDMVARLEERLKGDPGNLDGWLMLIRSRVTLDEPAKAKAALEAAVKANPDYADNLRAEAAKLGVR